MNWQRVFNYMIGIGVVLLLIALACMPSHSAENLIYKWSQVSFTESAAFAQVGQGQPERTRIGLVNREVNQAIRYVTDPDNKWQSPSETLQTRSGDCEDIAILKMQALMNIGVSKDRLTLLVVNDKAGNSHAVVQVNIDGEDVILDNLTLRIVPFSLYPNRVVDRFKL